MSQGNSNHQVIVNGPSREDMNHSLFVGDSPEERRQVSFQASSRPDSNLKMNFPFVIEGMQRVNDTGQDWVWTGVQVGQHGAKGRKGKGTYNTQTRTGTLVWLD